MAHFSRNSVSIRLVGLLALVLGLFAAVEPVAAQTQGPSVSVDKAVPDEVQVLRLKGEGFSAGNALFAVPCPDANSVEDIQGAEDCDITEPTAILVDEDGTFTAQVEWFIPAGGLFFVVGDAAISEVAFGFVETEEPTAPSLTATVPAPGLQDVTITGRDWTPGLAIFILPCPDVDDEKDATGDTCDISQLTPVTVGSDGTFEVTAQWDVPEEGLVFAAGDAAETQGATGTVRVDDGSSKWNTDAQVRIREARPVTGAALSVDYEGAPEMASLKRLAVVVNNNELSTSSIEVRFRLRCFDADGNVVAKRGNKATVEPGERFRKRLRVPAEADSCTVILRGLSTDTFDGSANLKIRSRG